MQALTLYDKSTNSLGIDAVKATDPEYEGWWNVEWRTDYTVKAIKDTDHKPEAHEFPVVTLDPDYKPRRPSK